MKTLYFLFTHLHQDTEVEFEAVTTDFHKFKEELQKLELDIEDEERFCKYGYVNMEKHLDGRRCTAYKFDVHESKRKVYILTANGNDRYCWEGKVLGVFDTKNAIKKYIISEELKHRCCSTKEEILGEFQEQDCQESFMSEYDSTYYDWFPVDLAKIVKEDELEYLDGDTDSYLAGLSLILGGKEFKKKRNAKVAGPTLTFNKKHWEVTRIALEKNDPWEVGHISLTIQRDGEKKEITRTPKTIGQKNAYDLVNYAFSNIPHDFEYQDMWEFLGYEVS